MIDKTKGFKWERNGPDHLVMATILARGGLDKYQNVMPSIVGAGMLDDINLDYGENYNPMKL